MIASEEESQVVERSRVLHAIVGHKLPVYFANAVDSVRWLAPDDDLLVVDNGSRMPALTHILEARAAAEQRVTLITRGDNDLSRNQKVGGLYDAYRDVMEFALAHAYDFVHLIQHDMQLVWWDARTLEMIEHLYGQYPDCVNIATVAPPRSAFLTHQVTVGPTGVREMTEYGLTDTGVIHLARWKRHGMRFAERETEHSQVYRRQGLRVFVHPIPCVAPVPWPAVVRNGRVRGKEVTRSEALLLRPLNEAEIEERLRAEVPVWLDDVAIPWGWKGLAPYWPTGVESIDYWVYLYRDLRARGFGSARPRWTGVSSTEADRGRRIERRPQPWEVLLRPPLCEARKRIRARRGTPN